MTQREEELEKRLAEVTRERDEARDERTEELLALSATQAQVVELRAALRALAKAGK